MKLVKKVLRNVNRVAVVVIFLASFFLLYLRDQYVVPILMYHRIDDRYVESKLSVSPESFARQMRFLKVHNYNVISLDEAAELFKEGSPIPHNTVVVTLDDGYENNYTNAFDVLKEYHIPATVFIVTEWVGKEDFLSWDQLREMAEAGVSIGSHTSSHPHLPSIALSEAKEEIFKSRRIIEEELGRKVTFLCYPFGSFNGKIRELVKDAGYRGACAIHPGRDYSDKDIYALKRMKISRTADNLFVFWIKVSGYHTWFKKE